MDARKQNFSQQENTEANHALFDDQDSRIRYVVTRLLRAGDFVRIEQIADELFVSRATIDRLMPDIRAMLKEYHLQVAIRPKYGIRVEGDEINKRLCYAHCAPKAASLPQEELTRQVQQIVLEVVERYGLVINDINLYNLIRHCVIAIRRMATGNRLTQKQALPFEGNVDREREAAAELTARFEAAFGVEIPPGEKQYIMMHLLGKRIMRQGQTLTDETMTCVERILEEIRREKGIDLTGDAELHTALALHMQPLLSRLRFGLRQENPVLQDIKRDMSQAYDLAVCAVHVVYRDYNLQMDEEEAGYLALHFAMALEKRQTPVTDRKVMVVCASGRGTARLICHRLVERYRFKQENLILTSAFQLDRENFENVLCIFTTVPLSQTYPVPTVLVDMAMGERSQERVDAFLREAAAPKVPALLPPGTLIFPDCALSTREEVLDFLCAKVEETFSVGGEGRFTAQVKRREALSSTEVGSQVAMPHPYEYKDDVPAAAFLSLRKPIQWKFGPVRLVALLAIPPENEQMEALVEALSRLVMDQEAVRRLSRDLSETSLKKALTMGGDGK